LTFSNSVGMKNQYLYSLLSKEVLLKNIRFNNVTGSESPLNPMMHLNDLNSTKVVVDGLIVTN
jgi:hypothetical protein